MALTASGAGRADDVDIYLPAYQARGGGGQPQVMLIIDTSASMNTDLPGSRKTRIGVTRDVLSNLVRQHPGINFSLAVFNDNNWVGRKDAYSDLGQNGGRVLQGFSPEPRQSGESRNTLLTTINNKVVANTTTPLCETMSEVYRYFTGAEVLYGRQNTKASPPRDTSIEHHGAYGSPMRPCEHVYVIYMTDGVPLMDTQANQFIKKLTGRPCRYYDAAVPNTDDLESVENCLPQLTRFMAEHDLGDGQNGRPALTGIQHAYTFTIGFNTRQRLLEDAAQPPPGIAQGYYEANDRDGLDLAFSRILGSIIENEIQTQRFSTATNIEGTENLGQVYSPGFLPRGYVPWTGNLKKFAVDSTQPSNPIKRDLWSQGITETSAPDAVEQGGAGARMKEQVRTGRTLYTDVGRNAAFKRLPAPGTRSTLDTDGIDGRALGVLEQSRYTPRQLADWIYGLDVTNDSETDVRPWVMGDIVHSQPLAINYGCAETRADCSIERQRIRLFVGTNEGLLHAIDDSNGAERWAFWPRETAGMAVYRMLNTRPEYGWPQSEGGLSYRSQSTHYGVDGSPGAWLDYRAIRDAAGQRRVSLEKAVLAFGFGRGGRGYYGLNVIEPDAPQLAWYALDPDWGQSWSTPVATTLGDGRAVFLVGMGYDLTAGQRPDRGPSRFGAGMAVIDARSGTIIASLKGPSDSVPATITPVDRDFDGVVDSAFFGDTGGNIWFADLRLGDDGRGSKRTPADWQLHQVASLGRHDHDGVDRAFFNRANLVRTYLDQTPVDLLMLGSGDRADPLDGNSHDGFYILEVSRWLNDSPGDRTPRMLNNEDLINAPLQGMTYTLGAPMDRQGFLDRQAFHGWRLMLSAGEKILSDASTIAGNTLFTSYHPEVPDDMCMAVRGNSRLYGFSLPVWRDNGHRHEQRTGTVKSADMGSYLQETPAFLIEGLRTRVLDTERAGQVAAVLEGGHGDSKKSEDDRCGQYDAVDGAFRECMVTAPLWWYQQ
ncbi:PilC/PilY family type IV pilus protein [Kushneria avicenniae]|nr:PilC/PilY family type IV pilus protein [Kushneria avicenniae]